MKLKIFKGLMAILGILVLLVGILGICLIYVQLKVPVDLPPHHSVAIYGGYAFIKGTWIIENDEQTFPLQTTEIECIQDQKICIEATAQVGFGGMLFVHLDEYEITSWTSTHIIFKNTAPVCVEYIYSVDLITKRVTATRTPKKLSSKESCAEFEKKDLHLALVNGSDVNEKERHKNMPWIGEGILRLFGGN